MFISDYEKLKCEIENGLYDIEHGVKTVSSSEILDPYFIIFDIENMTGDDFEELYPYDDLKSIRCQYEHLLKEFRRLLERLLVCAYKEGEPNIVYADYYVYKGENVPTFELLSLLPDNFELTYLTPEEHYKYSLNSYNEHAGKLSLFISARAGYKPAVKLAKEKYGWDF